MERTLSKFSSFTSSCSHPKLTEHEWCMWATIPFEERSKVRGFGSFRRELERHKDGPRGANALVGGGDAGRFIFSIEVHSFSASPSPFSLVSNMYRQRFEVGCFTFEVLREWGVLKDNGFHCVHQAHDATCCNSAPPQNKQGS